MPDFSDLILDLARDIGYSDVELKRLRRKMAVDRWVLAPLVTVGLVAWIYVFTVLI